jgi:hypothetical protein
MLQKAIGDATINRCPCYNRPLPLLIIWQSAILQSASISATNGHRICCNRLSVLLQAIHQCFSLMRIGGGGATTDNNTGGNSDDGVVNRGVVLLESSADDRSFST